MGMHGPLTARGLGRSPYDDVVPGEGEDDPRAPPQQYDDAGRPINPETVRINRDIIRSHNEVMMVIGVAEPEVPVVVPDHDLKRQHEMHEDAIASRLSLWARRCIGSIGLFGVDGLRDRVLVYRRYSDTPFWKLFREARGDFSIARLAGAPAGLLLSMGDRNDDRFGPERRSRSFARRCLEEARSYFYIHLELYMTMQRLGLISTHQWLPRPGFFIPFSSQSPIMTPPAPLGFDLESIAQWAGGVLVSATPFLVWYMSQRLIREWRPQVWRKINSLLPTTAYRRRLVAPGFQSPSIEPAAASYPVEDIPPPPSSTNDDHNANGDHTDDTEPDTEPDTEAEAEPEPESTEHVRRPSVVSNREDDYASDEDTDALRATLISFDVEATESSADAPQGSWSAELRPSVTNDPRMGMSAAPVYCDMSLTQVPVMIAARLFADTATRILIAPYEATSLRLFVRAFRLRAGLPCWDVLPVNVMAGMSSTLCMNYLGVELLQLILSSGVWAVFTGISQGHHMSEEAFKDSKHYKRENPQAGQ